MRPEKQLLVDEIKEQMDQHGSFVIMNYIGLPANQLNEFRTQISDIGGDVEFVRKRILVRAAKESGIDISLDQLPGHIGMVFSKDDPLAVAKTIVKLRKETGKAVNLVGGRFDGVLYNAEEVEKISKLPNKDEMRAQLLSVLQAPMTQTVGAMNNLLSSIVYCLDNKSKQQ